MSFPLLSSSIRSASRNSYRAFNPAARQAARKYSTEAPKKSSNGLLFGTLFAVAAAGAGGAYYYYSNPSAFTTAAFKPTKEDYQKVYNRIADMLDEADDYDDGSYGPVVLRLAWHTSGTYDKASGTGGSNYATMRFAPESVHGANAGLDVARGLMEEIHKKFPWISYGDLWTLGGIAAVQEMGGPRVPWRPGRVDGVAENVTPDGRLPDAAQGADHVRAVFGRMGFNDQETVALVGAHALGRAHKNRSGFDGPWTFSPITMTNDFFALLLSEKWGWKKWDGPKQLEDKATRSLMMLPTDHVMVTDKGFKKYVQAYANDQDLFFKDFSKAVSRLFELGVPTSQFPADQWVMKTVEEQNEEKK